MCRRSRWAGLAAALLSLASAGPVVTVVDGEGRPVRGVAVLCTRGVSGTGLTDDQGRVAVPDGCLEVECMRGGFVTGRASVAGGAATCRMVEPLVIRVEIHGAKHDAQYLAQIVSSETGQSVARGRAASSSTEGPLRFRIEAPAGAYGLRVFRFGDSWSCYLGLGTLTAGERDVALDWREPAEIAGVVFDPAARPFGRVLLHVVYDDAYDDTSAEAERVRCELDRQALDVISERSGRFRALVDPGRTYRIVADDAWQPATVRLDSER